MTTGGETEKEGQARARQSKAKQSKARQGRAAREREREVGVGERELREVKGRLCSQLTVTAAQLRSGMHRTFHTHGWMAPCPLFSIGIK